MNEPMNESGGGETKIIVGVIVLILFGALLYYYGGTKPETGDKAQTPPQVEEENTLPETLNQDSTAEINTALEGIDLGDIDADLDAIDSQLENL